MNNKKKIVLSPVLNAVAALISIVSLAPLVWLIYSSFKTKSSFLLDPIALPQSLAFENYSKAMSSGDLLTAIGNSAFNVVVNIVLVTIVAVVTGYFFARFKFRGKGLINMVYLIGMLIPLYALLIPIYVEFSALGLTNTRFALMFPYFGMQISICIFLAQSFIQDIPYSIEEAAIVDGCSLSQVIRRIIIPISGPIIATICILTLLATWNEFPFASVLSATKDLRTVSVAVQAFSTGKNIEYTQYMAALVISSLPVIIAYLLFSKQVIKGLTAGAVKG